MWFTLFDVVPPRFLEKYNLSYLLLGALVISWIASSIANAQFNREIHWAPRRANISKKLILEIQKKYSTAPKNAVIVVTKSDENVWALGDQNALRVIYQDQSIQTLYE